MKKLLNTLYVTSKDAYLSLDRENVVILKGDEVAGRFPLHNFEGIVTFGYTGASPALMAECAKCNIALTFMSSSGRFLVRTVGEVYGNVTLRKKQIILSELSNESLRIAKNMIIGKVFNSKWIIERAIRDYPFRLDIDKLKNISNNLTDIISYIQICEGEDELRGLEGTAASQYFSCFDDLILQQKDDFYFKCRNKRPPLDNVNALLSFTYTLLVHDIGGALESVGLDPYIGFLHKDRPGRISLALDLVEELRSVYADRFVISIINKREVKASGFVMKENGAVIMDDDMRKSILTLWQARKQEELTHPFLKEKISWGLVPHVQSMLLARYIRGDLDEYPPFMWK